MAKNRDGSALLICYLPIGDPDASLATAGFYLDHGVDVIEAGFPVANPVLDGPEISSSMARAIQAGVTNEVIGAGVLEEQLSTVGNAAAVWMSYCAAPDASYMARVASSGASMVLLPDADPLEVATTATKAGLRAVPFLSNSPRQDQVETAKSASSDYAMVAAAAGVTGARATVSRRNATTLARLRRRGVNIPIALGFGISGAAHVRSAIDLGADGVVVGSACVRAARQGRVQLSKLLTELRQALDEK